MQNSYVWAFRLSSEYRDLITKTSISSRTAGGSFGTNAVPCRATKVSFRTATIP
jgi:hypothetical protein